MALRENFLHALLSQPTAPFREGAVIATLIKELSQALVPHFLDPNGNIVVGVSSEQEYRDLVQQKSDEPLRLFIAHMDHPGFHGVQWKSKTELEIKWHGGSPTEHLEGASVWISCRPLDPPLVCQLVRKTYSGKLTHAQLAPHGRAISSGTVIFESELTPSERAEASSFYGGFSFRAPVWQEGSLLYTKAADDLVGAFSIASVAIDLWEKKQGQDSFLGLLTRAEEVGFIGALAHLEQGWLDHPGRLLLCVSLETSRTLPGTGIGNGAEIGKGPVVRLGDRFTVFHPAYLNVFTTLAQKLLPGKYQRRMMDGGSCEASATTAYGLPSIGISVPLGNYHNQSFEGGPDAAARNGPAPEFVHMDDIEGLITLCHGLLEPGLPWLTPWKNKKEEFKKSLNEYSLLMNSVP